MVTKNAFGGAAVMSPSASSMKHSLRSATKAKEDAERLEEVALMKEEEKLMEEHEDEDEEITSEEEVEDDEATEHTMLTVALVKSVVETRKPRKDPSSDPVDPSKHHYGLRKRRRPSGQDLERLEHFQSTREGGLARLSRAPEDDEVDIEEMPPPPKAAKKKEKTARGSRDRVKQPQQSLLSSSVPDPLLKTAMQPPSVGARRPDTVSTPCPLPVASAAQEATTERKRVTISEPHDSRKRGISIDLDLGLEFPDDTQTNANASSGRDRAFSFECFAFGINADEPLPPLGHPGNDQDAQVTGRPRGDSIIFDPVSFQDGGIHEQSALEKTLAEASAAGAATAAGGAVNTGSHVVPVKPAPAPSVTTSAPPVRRVVPTHTAPATSTATAPASSSSSTTAVTSTATGTGALSLELLNKDGRIGIYLPEARKARIARFHAKRSRRIWRKRIKYDCRKKLADSRPRIKGRFVKRSDMEDM